MNLEKGRISGSGVVWLITGFVLGSSLVILPGQSHDAWISIIMGFAEGLAFAVIYLLLAMRFKGRTLDQIVETVYGPVLGRVVAALFFLYLFHLSSLVLGNFAYFFQTAFMPETPYVVFTLLLALVAAWGARNGVEVLTRCSQILVPLGVALLLLTDLLLLTQFRPEYFLPVGETPFRDLVRTAHTVATFPFGEVVAFLMIIPFLNKKGEIPRATITGLASGAFFLLMITFRSIGVLGPSAGVFTYPNFEAARLVSFGRFLSRFELVVGVNMVTLGFLKYGVLLYGISLGTAQILRLRDYRPLVLPLMALTVLLSQINYPNTSAQNKFVLFIYPYFALPFQVGIPLLTLFVAKIRGLPRKEAES